MGVQELMYILHYIGIAWGVGGATFATILNAKAGKDKALAPLVSKMMKPISVLMQISIVLLIVSGVILKRVVEWPIDGEIYMSKIILFMVLLVVVIVMITLSTKIKKLTEDQNQEEEKILKLKKAVKVFSIISLILWYVILVVSVLM